MTFDNDAVNDDSDDYDDDEWYGQSIAKRFQY